jgi:transposase InsO family protein
MLAQLIDWRAVLTIVQPATLTLRCPQANAFCDRLIGTIRRECLDWLIMLHELHLRAVLVQWVAHYNQARPHASLGPGIPDVPVDRAGATERPSDP